MCVYLYVYVCTVVVGYMQAELSLPFVWVNIFNVVSIDEVLQKKIHFNYAAFIYYNFGAISSRHKEQRKL